MPTIFVAEQAKANPTYCWSKFLDNTKFQKFWNFAYIFSKCNIMKFELKLGTGIDRKKPKV